MSCLMLPEIMNSLGLITRWRSGSFAEYCKHFVAGLNDVHAFGYNSAGSERIWMKFGKLPVHCLELSLIRAEAGAGAGAQAKLLFFSPQNTSFFAWSKSTISDFRSRFLLNDYKSWKVMTGWTTCGMLASQWHRWNELKMIPLACSSRTRRAIFSSKILFYDVHRRRLHGMLHNAQRCK